MVRLLAPFAKVKIGERTYQTGDGILRHVAVNLGEDKRASNCRFELVDPGMKIAAEFFEMSFTKGGIEVPSDLLEDPSANAAGGGTIGLDKYNAAFGTGSSDGAESSVQAGELSVREKAFLDMIAWAEGTLGPDGYRTMFTGKKFDGFAKHPDKINCSGRLCSDAAGRYQFLFTTWSGLGLPDFTPPNQDRGAIKLIKQAGALGDVNAGRVEAASIKVKSIWASFPGAGYNQPEKQMVDLKRQWEKALVKYGGGGTATPTPAPTPAPAATGGMDSTAAVQDKATTAATEVSKKGQEIIISLGFNPSQTIEYHFIHTATNTQGRGNDQTVFEGQSIRWLMTRRKLNTTYSNITLRDFASKVCQRYGLKLEMEGNGPTYQHLDQTGITDYELLLRECFAIGYRVTDKDNILKIGPVRPNFTGFVITKDTLQAGGLSFSDRASKDMPANSNAPASQPPVAAAEQKTELDRNTGQPKPVTQEDSTATTTTDTKPAATVTGTAKPAVTGTVLDAEQTGLPKQEIGAIDLADGRAEAQDIKDESRRMKGYESRASLYTSPEALTLAPGSIVTIDPEIVPDVFAREWRVGSVNHAWQVGSAFTTSIELYSPQRQKPAGAGAAGGGGIGLDQYNAAFGSGSGTATPGQVNPGGFICPVATGTFGDGIGWRPKAGRNHNGVDISANTGTIIFAPADGVVVETKTGCRLGDVECGGRFGNQVVIKHANNIYSRVAHLYAVTAKKGDQVRQGQTVGSVGSTGRSSGPHLHFEFRRGGSFGPTIPPSELGVTYAGIGGSKRGGMKY